MFCSWLSESIAVAWRFVKLKPKYANNSVLSKNDNISRTSNKTILRIIVPQPVVSISDYRRHRLTLQTRKILQSIIVCFPQQQRRSAYFYYYFNFSTDIQALSQKSELYIILYSASTIAVSFDSFSVISDWSSRFDWRWRRSYISVIADENCNIWSIIDANHRLSTVDTFTSSCHICKYIGAFKLFYFTNEMRFDCKSIVKLKIQSICNWENAKIDIIVNHLDW